MANLMDLDLIRKKSSQTDSAIGNKNFPRCLVEESSLRISSRMWFRGKKGKK